ncbi:MAG: hypothetical protein H6559_26685 [Lewinellaceae bacterium]|nr:hypothetical protein [Lewinellaceae bacterium]
MAILIFQDIIIIPVMLAVPYLVIALMPIWKPSGNYSKVPPLSPPSWFWYFDTYCLPYCAALSIPATRNCFYEYPGHLLCHRLHHPIARFEAGVRRLHRWYLIVSESEYSYNALSKILPLKKIFLSLFFISIGMMLQLPFFFENWILIVYLYYTGNAH